MLRLIPCCLLLACASSLLSTEIESTQEKESGEKKANSALRDVHLKLLDVDCKTPLENVKVIVFSEPYPLGFHQPVADGLTDKEGWVKLPLEQGEYSLKLDSESPRHFLELHERTIGVYGYDHQQNFVRSVRAGCEVIFKVIDDETKEGVAGAGFWENNDLGEIWYEISTPNNIGIKKSKSTREEGIDPRFVTDDQGIFRMMRFPQRGYTYHVIAPNGYEAVTPDQFDFDIPSEGKIERTFHVRRKK